MSTRRDFLAASLKALAAGALLSADALSSGCTPRPAQAPAGPTPGPGVEHPNILFLIMDQYRVPPIGYGPNEGEIPQVKEVLGFAPQLTPSNPFAGYFEGIARLRRHATVLRQHHIAATACVPSRVSMMTGQYSSLTGVTETDGILKTAEEIRFLDPGTVPTLGDWFRAAGYRTHYFGKWHLSDVKEPYDLTPWGFDGWETSGPEPHPAAFENFGALRDPDFAQGLVDFLEGHGRCGSAQQQQPWMAVGSIVNPHDTTAYPLPFYHPNGSGVMLPPAPGDQIQPIPPRGAMSRPDKKGRRVALNPDGFPQDVFRLPQSAFEDLSTKPRCQREYSYKLGLARKMSFSPEVCYPHPFQLSGPRARDWAEAFGQFYIYLHYLADLQLRRILQALDRSGLADRTIIVMTADHGEYGAAHGMMVQKWHTAYQEVVHVPLVVSSPLINPSADRMREVQLPTSHIDLTPTLLGLAGFGKAELPALKAKLTRHRMVRDFSGVDLAPLVRNPSSPRIDGVDGQPRPGVLFISDEEVTAPSRYKQTSVTKRKLYGKFLNAVERVRGQGVALEPGSVVQPNHVRSLCSGDWKLVRYWDPTGGAPDEWELYHLRSDPSELTNLVDFRTGKLRTDVSPPGLDLAELQRRRDELVAALAAQEKLLLQSS